MTSAADMPSLAEAKPSVHRRTGESARLIRPIGYVAVALALTVACTTFFVLMGLTPVAPTQTVVFWSMAINGVLVSILIGLIGWELIGLVVARRHGRAAARLHIRIVMLFSVVAAAPAILVAVVASITLDRGLDHWFSTRTQAIVDTSLKVAQSYLQEHGRSIGADLLALKNDFERARSLQENDPQRYQTFIDAISSFRSIPGIYVMNRDSSVVARASVSARANFPLAPDDALAKAESNNGVPVLIAPGETNLVGGVVRLGGYENAYLYMVRPIDATVVKQVQLVSENANEYKALQETRFGVQVAFGLLYLGISMVVLLSAIWLGIGFANRLVSPIRHLIDAADQVAHGNLAVEVPAKASDGDIGALGTTFNKMTSQLRTQRSALVRASEQIDARRRFSEAVLAGVSAGVIGIDSAGAVTIVNRMALRLLALSLDGTLGRDLADVVPELAPLVAAALADPKPEHHDQITIGRAGRERSFNVRVTTESTTAESHGYVVTLDDITDLVTAQRSSAWADVARRIAHEIKNPLTPIQLSAERLRRRFGKLVVDERDREVFDQCTDTIVRQVGDIGRMVDEFSSFARMPKPAFEHGNLNDAVRDAVFLTQVGHPHIGFSVETGGQPLVGRFDGRLMAQAITNVVKNAAEAIAALPPEKQEEGKIRVVCRVEGDGNVIEIIDNGIGLPGENRQRLLEPYMTTREKGTGLGLAIVRKIIEEHGGRIDLLDAPGDPDAGGGRGAMIRITLPRGDAAPATSSPPSEPEVPPESVEATASDHAV